MEIKISVQSSERFDSFWKGVKFGVYFFPEITVSGQSAKHISSAENQPGHATAIYFNQILSDLQGKRDQTVRTDFLHHYGLKQADSLFVFIFRRISGKPKLKHYNFLSGSKVPNFQFGTSPP